MVGFPSTRHRALEHEWQIGIVCPNIENNTSAGSVVISGNGMQFIASVSSPVFVRGVELKFSDVDVTVDKNYFDITSKAPVRVRLTTKRMTTVEKLQRVLKVRTVCDIGGDC